MKVKFTRPVYPYGSGEIVELDERKLKSLEWMYEIVEEKKVKQVKKAKNKAILKNKNTK